MARRRFTEISLKFLSTGKLEEVSVPFPGASGYAELQFASMFMLRRPGDIAREIPRRLKAGRHS